MDRLPVVSRSPVLIFGRETNRGNHRDDSSPKTSLVGIEPALLTRMSEPSVTLNYDLSN